MPRLAPRAGEIIHHERVDHYGIISLLVDQIGGLKVVESGSRFRNEYFAHLGNKRTHMAKVTVFFNENLSHRLVKICAGTRKRNYDFVGVPHRGS